MKKVEIFTDGACKGNPGIGGWGAILRYGKHEKKINGAARDTTNNRMELTAVIRALETLKGACVVHLTTDSQYVQKGITEWLPEWKKRNWKTSAKKPVKNVDLWQVLDTLAAKHQVHWHWVRGHAGHLENEMVDELANKAIKEILNSKF